MDGWGGNGLCLEVELMKHFTKQGSKNKGIRAVRREPLRRERPFLLVLIVCCELKHSSCRETRDREVLREGCKPNPRDTCSPAERKAAKGWLLAIKAKGC